MSRHTDRTRFLYEDLDSPRFERFEHPELTERSEHEYSEHPEYSEHGSPRLEHPGSPRLEHPEHQGSPEHEESKRSEHESPEYSEQGSPRDEYPEYQGSEEHKEDESSNSSNSSTSNPSVREVSFENIRRLIEQNESNDQGVNDQDQESNHLGVSETPRLPNPNPGMFDVDNLRRNSPNTDEAILSNQQEYLQFPELSLDAVAILQAILLATADKKSLRGVLHLKSSYPDCNREELRREIGSAEKNSATRKSECGIVDIDVPKTVNVNFVNAQEFSNDRHSILWSVHCGAKFRWWHVSSVVHQLLRHNVDIVFLFKDVYWRICGQRTYPEFSVERIISSVAVKMDQIEKEENEQRRKPHYALKKWLNNIFKGWLHVQYHEYHQQAPSVVLDLIDMDQLERLGSNIAIYTLKIGLEKTYELIDKYQNTDVDEPWSAVYHIMTCVAISTAKYSAKAHGIDVNNLSEDIEGMCNSLRILSTRVSLDSLDSLLHVASSPLCEKAASQAYKNRMGQSSSTFEEFLKYVESRQDMLEEEDLISGVVQDVVREVNEEQEVQGIDIAKDPRAISDAVVYTFHLKIKPLLESIWSVTLHWSNDMAMTKRLIIWSKIAAFASSYFATKTNRNTNNNNWFDNGCEILQPPVMLSPTPIQQEMYNHSHLDDLTIALNHQISNYKSDLHTNEQIQLMVGTGGKITTLGTDVDSSVTRYTPPPKDKFEANSEFFGLAATDGVTPRPRRRNLEAASAPRRFMKFTTPSRQERGPNTPNTLNTPTLQDALESYNNEPYNNNFITRTPSGILRRSQVSRTRSGRHVRRELYPGLN